MLALQVRATLERTSQRRLHASSEPLVRVSDPGHVGGHVERLRLGTGLGVGTLLALADGSWLALPGEGESAARPSVALGPASVRLQGRF